MSPVNRFLLIYGIFLALVAAGLAGWNATAVTWHTHHLSWGIFAFFAIAYLGSHFYIRSSEDKRPAIFVRRFMAVTTIRLMVFIGILVTYAFMRRHEAVVFISHFLAFYVVFTIFEVASLYQHFKKKD